MKKTTYIAILLSSVILIVSSCTKDTKDTSSDLVLGYDYYPTTLNKYVIYSVEEIDIDVEIGKYDTTRYLLKEVVADTIFSEYKDANSFKIERYILLPTSKSWEEKNVWLVKKSKSNLIRIEDNIPLVKMVFPMVKNQNWNINRYDTLEDKECTLYSLGKADTVNTIPFDNVLQMVQADYESLIDKQYETEKYALGVGLIYKQKIDIESQSNDITSPIMKLITSGTIVTWKVVSHN